MVVSIQKFQKCMYNTSRNIIRYFSTVASQDPLYGELTGVMFFDDINRLPSQFRYIVARGYLLHWCVTTVIEMLILYDLTSQFC